MGLGAMWGEQKALEFLKSAGFANVEVRTLERTYKTTTTSHPPSNRSSVKRFKSETSDLATQPLTTHAKKRRRSINTIGCEHACPPFNVIPPAVSIGLGKHSV